jgi:cytochrome bd-type quinol oxidase subunit 2
VVLGQTALVLYFVHQLIAFTLVKEWLGWRFNAWPRYWVANAVFVVLLIGCGWLWREIRGRVGRARRPVLVSSG